VFKHVVSVPVALGLLALLGSPAPAQRDFQRFLKPPETAREFWDAMNFEINVGRYDLAADHLKGLVNVVKDHDDDLLQIEEKEGLAAFLRLRLIAKWSNNAQVNKEAKDNVEALIAQTTKVLKNHLTNPDRITKFTKNLTAPTKEERDYALMVLQQAGAAAVPHLLTVLRETQPDAPEHQAIISILPRLRRDTLPALHAALDASPDFVRAELIDVLRERQDRTAVPFLWYFWASPKQPEMVRQRAAAALAALTTLKPDKLPPAKQILTQEADRYYRHEVYRDRATGIPVWSWDEPKKALASRDMTPTQAEEYYGTRFARQALDLDPTYEPAQVVLASLVLEKAYERGGIDNPLPPETRELLNALSPDLLVAVLNRGLADHRVPAIVGAARALGDLGAVQAARAGGRGSPVLVRALNYPDRRVQMAAADALLSMPGQVSTVVGARIVEVLRRAVAAEPDAGPEPSAARALVGDFNGERGRQIARALRQAGFQVGEDDIAPTGRELLRRLGEAADVDFLVVDAALPYPQLPYLVAQLRADRNSGLLPLFVLAPADRELSLRRQLERYSHVWVVADVLWRDPQDLKNTILAAIGGPATQPLSKEELRTYAAEAMRWLDRLATGEVPGFDVRPAEDVILRALRSNDLAPLAIDAVGHLPGAAGQQELASVVLDTGRDPKLRAAAAYQLAHQIQAHGVLLNRDQVRGLQDLYLMKGPDAKLNANLALIAGSLRPSAAETGQRLKEFKPTLPGPTEPPPPKEGE
jgi:hypothetical protein